MEMITFRKNRKAAFDDEEISAFNDKVVSRINVVVSEFLDTINEEWDSNFSI